MENKKLTAKEKLNIWWQDKKIIAGFVLVISSFLIGFYGKGLFVIKFFEPIYALTGLSIWIFSWILLFLGVFLVGWETIKIIQNQIHSHIKKTVRKTYDYTKKLPIKFSSKKFK